MKQSTTRGLSERCSWVVPGVGHAPCHLAGDLHRLRPGHQLSTRPPLSWYTMAVACLLGTVFIASGSCGHGALLATFAFLAYIVDLSGPFLFLLYFCG